MKTVAIVQARMGSTRLPGKVLMDLAGETVLARVVSRTRRATLVQETMVATTNATADDLIVRECQRLGVGCFRGSEQDVLDRYYRAALECTAGVVVRVTADCPLIDPEMVDRVVQEFHDYAADYASNDLVPTYPLGLGVEVFTHDALTRAWRDASLIYERRHVTPHLYRHPELFRIHRVAADSDHSEHRWTLDVSEDLTLLREIFVRLADPHAASWRDVLDLVTLEPELAAINSHIRQKTLEEG